MINTSIFQRETISQKYYDSVSKDIAEVKINYKYIEECFSIGLAKPCLRIFKVLAVSNGVLKETYSSKEDFLGPYSQEIIVVVPENYKIAGCIVYGLKWNDLSLIENKDLHINKGKDNNGYHELCVGVPESFSKEKNAILASIRTAEYITTAYKLYLTKQTEKVELISYSHGEKGREEYAKRNKK